MELNAGHNKPDRVVPGLRGLAWNKAIRIEETVMIITINGKEEVVPESISVTELLIEKDVETPEMVSVELNDEILDRIIFETTLLKKGDQVEFLYFMGGGIS
jgi:sulfur carrier protein